MGPSMVMSVIVTAVWAHDEELKWLISVTLWSEAFRTHTFSRHYDGRLLIPPDHR